MGVEMKAAAESKHSVALYTLPGEPQNTHRVQLLLSLVLGVLSNNVVTLSKKVDEQPRANVSQE